MSGQPDMPSPNTADGTRATETGQPECAPGQRSRSQAVGDDPHGTGPDGDSPGTPKDARPSAEGVRGRSGGIALGAFVTAGVTAFGLVATFIGFQDEPGKLWNSAVALIVTTLILAGLWSWDRSRRSSGSAVRRRQLVLSAAAVGLALLIGVGGFVLRPERDHDARPPPPTGISPTPVPSGDVRIHEVWASSAENSALVLRRGDWAMTDFKVTQPYLRSIEVAAGSDGPGKLQLTVYDEHRQEIASGEATVQDWRVKVTFDKVIDIRPYLEKRLYLLARNVDLVPVRVYFTKNDRDPSVTSYVSCATGTFLQCPNPRAQDLSSIVMGRSTP